MQAMSAAPCPLSGLMKSFLDFCRVEKGLAANSLQSYQLDLQRLSGEFGGREQHASHAELSGYVQSLYTAQLSPRTIARHITTLRNYYGFLVREEEISQDPTEFLALPKQWTTIPKYLNREEV